MALPKRHIDELVTLHCLEAKPVDIYVEGPLDEAVIRWAIRPMVHREVQVLSVDTVEVDGEEPISGGNRGRLIALAGALQGRIPDHKVSCICDRDFENWIPTIDQSSHAAILFTDFANLEAYYLSKEILEKFLSLAIGGNASAEGVLVELVPVLRDAFLLRLAHASLNWPLHWIELGKYCSLNKNREVVFNKSAHLQSLLQKNRHGCISSGGMVKLRSMRCRSHGVPGEGRRSGPRERRYGRA